MITIEQTSNDMYRLEIKKSRFVIEGFAALTKQEVISLLSTRLPEQIQR